MLLAQLTDTHVVDRDLIEGAGADSGELYVDNNRRLALAVERLNRETVKPDVVVGTGDLTDNGTESEMAELLELLEPLEIPFFPLVGNHDRKDTFASCFAMTWASPTNLSWAVDVGPIRLLGLDTMVNQPDRADLEPGDIHHGGIFDDERARWLSNQLSAAESRPVVIAMHHPPFKSGIHWMDKNGLQGTDRFVDVVSSSPASVERILCGHLHRPITTTVAGVIASTGISTVQHVELNLDPAAPVQLVLDSPGYELHHFERDSSRPGGLRCTTHVRHFDTGHDPINPSWAK